MGYTYILLLPACVEVIERTSLSRTLLSVLPVLDHRQVRTISRRHLCCFDQHRLQMLVALLREPCALEFKGDSELPRQGDEPGRFVPFEALVQGAQSSGA